MKTVPEHEEIRKEMADHMMARSTDYIDWDELYHGDKEKSGSDKAAAFCDGFKEAVLYLSLNNIIPCDYIKTKD